MLFHRLVTRHLFSLAERLSQTDLVTFAARSFSDAYPHGRQDEIQRVIQGLERMRTNLTVEMSERQEIERQLTEQERERQELFDAIAEAVFIVDIAARSIIEVNEQSCRLYHCTREDLIGLTIEDLSVTEQHSAADADALLATAISQGHVLFPWTIKRPDGTTFEAEVSIRPLHFRGADCMIATVRDVTVLREAEDRLRQLQKMDSIGQLAGGIAHDFNNMLAGIRGSAELLQLGRGDARMRERLLNTILTASDRAADMTQKLLSFSRRDLHRRQALDLHEIIDDALTIVERSIDPRISIVRKLCASPSTVLGDASALQNVVINLCLNARDAMVDGGTISLRTQVITLAGQTSAAGGVDLQTGSYVELGVRDTGHGMDEAIKSRIFEPFFTSKAVGKGTGLGLAAVYGIVNEHGGGITVHSAPDAGADFRILLPLHRCAEPASSVRPAVTVEARGHGTVLVIDDEDLVRNSISLMLEELGYEVVSAADGAEGLRVYEQHADRIRLAIVDMTMPVLNGRDTFLQLQRQDPALPVVLCTGYAQATAAEDMLDRGLAGMLRKPIGLNELSKLVNGILGVDEQD